MRSSDELVELVAAAGGECCLLSGGTSYRAGGEIVISRKGYWEAPSPVRVERTEERCFDGTGYDGRGRTWNVWKLVPDAGGMVPVTSTKWSVLPEKDRAVIGSATKSGSLPLYFGRPQADRMVDIAGLLSGLGL